MKTAHLYAIGPTDNHSLIKVGVSQTPKSRLSNLQTANAERLVLRFVSKSLPEEEAYAAENRAHSALPGAGWERLQGEWFKNTQPDAQLPVSLFPPEGASVPAPCLEVRVKAALDKLPPTPKEASADKLKRPTFTTPAGYARWPHLNKPDTRFNAEGDYKCDVRLWAADAAPLIEHLEKIRDEFFESQEAGVKKSHKKDSVFTVELDDEGAETGYVIIKTKLNANGKNKITGETWKNEPKLFDAAGAPLPKTSIIWSGTKLAVAGTVNTYALKFSRTIGVTLKCRAVQVIELITAAENNAESFGFKCASA